MKVIDTSKINELYTQAFSSERKRTHHLLHSTHNEKVQRLLISLVKGSYVEPHYHNESNQWELFVVLQGQILLTMYNETGDITKKINLGPQCEAQLVEIYPNEIHSVECISETALMLEVKEGPFNESKAKVLMARQVNMIND
ncbi:TPA: WbuC family cupin fold metalloprotein [Citrobacter sedlakii]